MQSLVNILENYYKNKSKDGVSDVKKLYTIHRLDRLTSGLVIFGKTSSVAKAYSKCIMNRSSKKIYLARVAGKFPLKCRGLKKLSSKQFVQSGIPVNGEWNDETLTGDEVGDPQKNQASSSCSNEKEKLYSVARLRHQHALACWTEDGNGTPIFGDNGESETDMLERVFRCRHRYVRIALFRVFTIDIFIYAIQSAISLRLSYLSGVVSTNGLNRLIRESMKRKKGVTSYGFIWLVRLE